MTGVDMWARGGYCLPRSQEIEEARQGSNCRATVSEEGAAVEWRGRTVREWVPPLTAGPGGSPGATRRNESWQEQ